MTIKNNLLFLVLLVLNPWFIVTSLGRGLWPLVIAITFLLYLFIYPKISQSHHGLLTNGGVLVLFIVLLFCLYPYFTFGTTSNTLLSVISLKSWFISFPVFPSVSLYPPTYSYFGLLNLIDLPLIISGIIIGKASNFPKGLPPWFVIGLSAVLITGADKLIFWGLLVIPLLYLVSFYLTNLLASPAMRYQKYILISSILIYLLFAFRTVDLVFFHH